MSEVKRHDCTNGNARHCYGCYQMEEVEDGSWVQAHDYDAAQSELAALREELAKYRNLNDSLIAVNLELANCKDTYKKLREKKVAAEQRNAALCKLLLHVQGVCLFSIPEGMHDEIDDALKPTESGETE